MKKENFREIFEKLGLEKNKWYIFHEIYSIILNTGRGIYPDWKHTRFLITDDDKILIRYGNVKPYGARLGNFLGISSDFLKITFPIFESGILLEPSSFYNEGFRQPKQGDIIRASESVSNIIGESMIVDIRYNLNGIVVELFQPLKFTNKSRLSFYDPEIFTSGKNCINGTIEEGVYMEFYPNEPIDETKLKSNHETIKCKEIREINLKVGADFFRKTYKLD